MDVEKEAEVATAPPSPLSSAAPSRHASPAPVPVAEPRIAVEPRQAIADTPAIPAPSTSHTDTSSSHGPNPTQPSKSIPIAPPAPSGTSIRSGSPDENAAAAAKVKGKGEKQKARPSTDEKPLQDQIDNSQLPSSSSSTVPEPKRLKKQAKARASEAPPKRKADEFVESVSDAPAPTKKRRQGTVPVERVASSSSMNAVVQPKEEDESEDDHDALPQLKASSSKGKRKRATSSKPTKAHRASKLFALESPQKTNDTELIPEDVDAEIQGMIIECMATSRASSMPVSLVVRTVLQTHPGLKEKRTEKEWRKVVGRVLVNGMAGRGSGVFGKVDSSGKVSLLCCDEGLYGWGLRALAGLYRSIAARYSSQHA
jgi:hypothetical protein